MAGSVVLCTIFARDPANLLIGSNNLKSAFQASVLNVGTTPLTTVNFVSTGTYSVAFVPTKSDALGSTTLLVYFGATDLATKPMLLVTAGPLSPLHSTVGCGSSRKRLEIIAGDSALCYASIVDQYQNRANNPGMEYFNAHAALEAPLEFIPRLSLAWVRSSNFTRDIEVRVPANMFDKNMSTSGVWKVTLQFTPLSEPMKVIGTDIVVAVPGDKLNFGFVFVIPSLFDLCNSTLVQELWSLLAALTSVQWRVLIRSFASALFLPMIALEILPVVVPIFLYQ
jgi:hypothetical protein